jgi:hypothetical protein
VDIRDLIRNDPEMVFGHEPVTESLNVKTESRRFTRDPLHEYLVSIGHDGVINLHDDVGRYAQAFSWYTLCLRRTLEHSSIARRSEAQLRWHPRTVKYSRRQAQTAKGLRSAGPYLEVDYQNLIIHACILLDRTITLSRRFLRGGNLPSFTSFGQHKAFLKLHSEELDPVFRGYSEAMTNTTHWFEIPLKVLRDKYLMHSAEQHLSFFGWSSECQWDLEMTTIIPASQRQQKPLERVKVIRFSPRRLGRDIETFLSWFSQYARTATEDAES